jgi:hypothetical protein
MFMRCVSVSARAERSQQLVSAKRLRDETAPQRLADRLGLRVHVELVVNVVDIDELETPARELSRQPDHDQFGIDERNSIGAVARHDKASVVSVFVETVPIKETEVLSISFNVLSSNPYTSSTEAP